MNNYNNNNDDDDDNNINNNESNDYNHFIKSLKIISSNLVNEIIQKTIYKHSNNFIKKYINDFSRDIILNTNDNNLNNNIENKIIQNITNNNEYDEIGSWDDIINDKFYLHKNKISRIFPILKNKNDYDKLVIDDESFNYITIREVADYTSRIICHHLINDFLNPLKVIVCDLTAGVGGNTISFSNYFKYVYAIEIENDRHNYLINNLKIYERTNVTTYNKCALSFIETDLIKVNPSVLFIDPPWGGVGYKKNNNLQLFLGNLSLENLLISILNKFSISYKNCKKNLEYSSEHNKIIIFKLPKNYNVVQFYNHIKNSFINNYIVKQYLYIFNKMMLVICHCVYVNCQID